jgi:hypothetical protein
VRVTLKKLLQAAQREAVPRVHGNGFIQLDLEPDLRLHVWPDGLSRRVDRVLRVRWWCRLAHFHEWVVSHISTSGSALYLKCPRCRLKWEFPIPTPLLPGRPSR